LNSRTGKNSPEQYARDLWSDGKRKGRLTNTIN
jgi:hypothetical protein